jgi:hypothetical protein
MSLRTDLQAEEGLQLSQEVGVREVLPLPQVLQALHDEVLHEASHEDGLRFGDQAPTILATICKFELSILFSTNYNYQKSTQYIYRLVKPLKGITENI